MYTIFAASLFPKLLHRNTKCFVTLTTLNDTSRRFEYLSRSTPNNKRSKPSWRNKLEQKDRKLSTYMEHNTTRVENIPGKSQENQTLSDMEATLSPTQSPCCPVWKHSRRQPQSWSHLTYFRVPFTGMLSLAHWITVQVTMRLECVVYWTMFAFGAV